MDVEDHDVPVRVLRVGRGPDCRFHRPGDLHLLG
jgi:hypothetical protein